MASPREKLSLRAIVIGTRAAVNSHRRAGTERMIRAAAERGLQLLDELEARTGSRVDAEFHSALSGARRELTGLLHGTGDIEKVSAKEPSAREPVSRPE